MLLLVNALFFILAYVITVAYIISRTDFGRGSSDDGNDSGDGGWNDPPKDPPFDLPPGVFILPPDADDPSLKNRTLIEEEGLV